ncbi:hypothetical protein GCM10027270_20130 [Nocardioides ginkgobilobae]
MSPTHANISQVAPRLWIGGDLATHQPTLAAVQLHEIADLGITDIVDCRLEWSDEDWVTAAHPEMRYHWLGVDDAGQRMPDVWFDTGTALVRDALDAGGAVLAHCHMGINRGPSMGYAAMLSLGWDPIEGLDAIRRARPIAYVAYAEDAVDWWLPRIGADGSARDAARTRLAEWRRTHHLDVARVIRQVRLGQGA